MRKGSKTARNLMIWVLLLLVLGIICLIVFDVFFGSGKKKPLISVRVLTDDPQKILLSIRDEGIPFSPVDWEKIHHNDEDRTANIGIRMTAALTEEMRYVNVMNLNSLYITL